MAIKDLVVYCVGAADVTEMQARSALHKATPNGYMGVRGHYPVPGENLPAIVVKDIDATHRNLFILLPGDAPWYKENVVQAVANTQGTWS